MPNIPGATSVTQDLLAWWRRDGRQRPLFFAQLEAAETIIFLTEARADFLQGLSVPREEISPEQISEGTTGFARYACKMATGSGKTTVMGMLAAWSILNKVNDRSNAKYSDVVLVVCPNVTIRNRLRELDPDEGEASIYYTRDLVPPDMRTDLTKGRVLVYNWHVFQPQGTQTGGESAKVVKAGVAVERDETIVIGEKNTTARGNRYLTLETLQSQIANGMIEVKSEDRDQSGNLKKVTVRSLRYVESDTALVNRIVGARSAASKIFWCSTTKLTMLTAFDVKSPTRRRRRGRLVRRVFQRGDSLGRWTRPREPAARNQLLRRFIGHAVFLGARRPGYEPAISVGGERFRFDRRHRIGPDEDSTTRGSRHDRRRHSRLLQHLALDSG